MSDVTATVTATIQVKADGSVTLKTDGSKPEVVTWEAAHAAITRGRCFNLDNLGAARKARKAERAVKQAERAQERVAKAQADLAKALEAQAA